MGRKSRMKAERREARQLAKTLFTHTAGRRCGDCTECCNVLRVDEISKPPNQSCPHQCASGCANYDERPLDCRTFQCFWLAGWYDEEHRPDKIGLVVHGSTTETRALFGNQHVLLGTGLSEDDLFATDARRKFLAAHAAAGLRVVVVTGDGWFGELLPE